MPRLDAATGTAMTGAGVTIVVVNWNRRDETLACLASLARAQLEGAHVLVVDNGSRDGSAEAIRAAFPGVEVLGLPENRGYAGGCNAGMRAALERGADGVLLLNNDTEVAPDFLRPLLEAIDTDPTFAAVSSAVLRFDRPELLDVAYSEVTFGRRHVVQLIGVNALVGHGFDGRRQIPVATGCSVLLRAEALRAIGLFDEAYFAYHEDVDWCLRAAKRGYHFLYEPYSRVYHHRSRSTARPRPPRPGEPHREEPALPGAEEMSWNPVRAYLGARNVVRLQRAHTGRRNRAAFLVACLRELPLELAAIVLDREGWLRLGRWGWSDAFRDATIARHPALARLPGGLGRGFGRAALVPYDLFVATPVDFARAWRSGQLDELFAQVRGLCDGYLRRRLPLERLGLR